MSYSKKHIENKLSEIYGLHIQDEHDGEYKYYRNKRYHMYSVFDSENNVIMQHVTLQALGDFLRSKNEY